MKMLLRIPMWKHIVVRTTLMIPNRILLWILIKILINADEDDDAIMTCICTCQMMELFLQYIFNDLVFKQASEDSLLFICTALFL